MKQITLILAVLLVVSAAQAQESEESWSGKASLGYLATSGNTENSTLNTALELGYGSGDWQHTAKAFAVNAAEDNTTTAEAYELGWKSELSLGEVDYVFGRLNWRKDRFSGYDTQFSQSVGYGRRLIKTDVHELNAEIGVGARQSDLFDNTTEEEFIVRGGVDYKWHFSETANFIQEVSFESGDQNTYLVSLSSLSAKLYDDLALVLSYTIKNNSDVPVGREKRDTFVAVSLEYAF